MMRRQIIVWTGIAGLVLAGAILAATHKASHAQKAQAKQAPPAPTVRVEAVRETDVTPEFRYVGRAIARDSVAVRARITGFIEDRSFREGGSVKAGQTLFTIEKAPYEVIVRQRRADVAAAKAELKNASQDFERKSKLQKRGVVSGATFDESRAARNTAQASLLKAEAALAQAELDLNYTTITSPISGRIGKARFSVGNLVGPTSEPLAQVTSVDPIYVEMQISEQQLIEARKQGIDINKPRFKPTLILSDGTRYAGDGRFDFIAPQVDPTTDTITVRAAFDNPDGLLMPGQFVSVIVRQKAVEKKLTVAQAAINQDADGYFVLTVGGDKRVRQKRVTTGEQTDGRWVIEEGLSSGDMIIVQGVQKVKPDQVVQPIKLDAPDNPGVPTNSGSSEQKG